MTSDFNRKIKLNYDKISEIWNKEREWYIEQP